MKKITLIGIFITVAFFAKAQQANDSSLLLTNKVSTLRLALPTVVDPYLSPLIYSGIGFGTGNERSRLFKKLPHKWSMQQKSDASIQLLMNKAMSNEMIYLAANYGWGVNYFQPIGNGFKLLVGGLWDADFGFKNLSRNVNNTLNIDAATNLNLNAVLKYDYPLKRRTLTFRLSVQTPLIGYMFVPMSGASYYNLFQLGDFRDAFHFSSLHNKTGFNQLLSVDVPFNHCVWRFGFRANNLKYKANDMIFVRNEASIVVGTTFDFISFAGKKKYIPAGFSKAEN